MTDATYELVEGLDINATDTVFRSSSGRFVKVRVVRVAPPKETPFGMAVLHISGSNCDADGRAKKWGDGHQIGPVHPLTVQADKIGDITAVLAAKRLEVAAATERAVEMEEALA